jgi:hypothetical protein
MGLGGFRKEARTFLAFHRSVTREDHNMGRTINHHSRLEAQHLRLKKAGGSCHI